MLKIHYNNIIIVQYFQTSVGAIISRLETVRVSCIYNSIIIIIIIYQKYIEDARGLYEQLHEHFNEVSGIMFFYV